MLTPALALLEQTQYRNQWRDAVRWKDTNFRPNLSLVQQHDNLPSQWPWQRAYPSLYLDHWHTERQKVVTNNLPKDLQFWTAHFHEERNKTCETCFFHVPLSVLLDILPELRSQETLAQCSSLFETSQYIKLQNGLVYLAWSQCPRGWFGHFQWHRSTRLVHLSRC